MDNTITVFALLIPYFAVVWVLIGVSLWMVNDSIGTRTQIKANRNAVCDITARQNYYRKAA